MYARSLDPWWGVGVADDVKNALLWTELLTRLFRVRVLPFRANGLHAP
jgi:hypothetical protein